MERICDEGTTDTGHANSHRDFFDYIELRCILQRTLAHAEANSIKLKIFRIYLHIAGVCSHARGCQSAKYTFSFVESSPGAPLFFRVHATAELHMHLYRLTCIPAEFVFNVHVAQEFRTLHGAHHYHSFSYSFSKWTARKWKQNPTKKKKWNADGKLFIAKPCTLAFPDGGFARFGINIAAGGCACALIAIIVDFAFRP